MTNEKIISAVKNFAKTVSVIISNNTDNKIDTTVTINKEVVFKDKI